VHRTCADGPSTRSRRSRCPTIYWTLSRAKRRRDATWRRSRHPPSRWTRGGND